VAQLFTKPTLPTITIPTGIPNPIQEGVDKVQTVAQQSAFDMLVRKLADVPAGAIQSLCEKIAGKNSSACSGPKDMLDAMGAMMVGNLTGCSLPGPLSEANITIIIDLELAECQNVKLGCDGQQSVLSTVLKLLMCVITNLGGTLGSVPALLKNTLTANLRLTLGMLGLVLYSVINTVSVLLCHLDTIAFTVLCPHVGVLLFGVLVAASAALPAALPGLGVVLGLLVLILDLLLFPIVAPLGCAVGTLTVGVTAVLQVILTVVIALLKFLFNTTECTKLGGPIVQQIQKLIANSATTAATTVASTVA
jgi:hypothetical protein